MDFLYIRRNLTYQQGGTDGKYRVTSFDPAAAPAPEAPAQPTTSSGVLQMTKEEKKLAILNLEGLWQANEGQLLFEDPSKELFTAKKGIVYLWFRLVSDKSKINGALYQLVILYIKEQYKEIIDSGATIPSNMAFSDKFNSSCSLATMTYEPSRQAFKVTRVDVGDTSIHKFTYKGGEEDIIYEQGYETGNDEKQKANAYVSYGNLSKMTKDETKKIVSNETVENIYELTWQKNHEKSCQTYK